MMGNHCNGASRHGQECPCSQQWITGIPARYGARTFLFLLNLLIRTMDIPAREKCIAFIGGLGQPALPKKPLCCVLFILFAALWFAPNSEAGWLEATTCPATGEPMTIIHVRVFDLPDPSRTDTATRAEVAAIRHFVSRFPALFMERHRDRYQAHPERYGNYNWDRVAIQLHRFSGIQVPGVESDLLAIAGGVAPDILYVNFRKSDTYIRQGFLHPLDRPEDNYLLDMTPEELDFRVHEKIWPVIRRPGPDGQVQTWALPYGGALGRVLLYRKDIFDAAGIDYPTAEWNWDDLYHAARALTDPATGRYGLALGTGRHQSWFWITFLWSAGGEVMIQEEDSDEWLIAFDSHEAAVALDFYTRISTQPWIDHTGQRRYGFVHKDAGERSLKWERGEIGMMFAYIDENLFATINPDITGMAPVPLGPTGLRGAELNSRMMGLFSQIKNPVVRDAAWEFIRFRDNEESMEVYTRVMVEGGLGQFINPRLLERFGYADVIRLAPRGWADTFEIAIATGKPEPFGRHSNIAYNFMDRPIERAERMALRGELPEDEDERLAVLEALLHDAAQRAREHMLGVVPPRQLFQRRLSALIVLLSILVVFSYVFSRIVRTFTPADVIARPARTASWQLSKYAPAYVILLPAVLTILVWQYIPLMRGSIMAFQDYRLLGGSQWIWLDNFGAVLWDSAWWLSVWNAIRYSLLVIGLTFLPPILLAILLQEVPRGKIFFRTVFYLPAVITGLVVIILWKMFYDPSERGVLNAVLLQIPAIVFLGIGGLLFWIAFSFYQRLRFHGSRLGALLFLIGGSLVLYTCVMLARPILFAEGVSVWQRIFGTLPEPFRWLIDPEVAMLACVLPLVWAGMGPGCLIYLAALKGIPDDFYEAADMDGATFIDKILFIIFPMLKPLIIINFVGVFISSWYGATDNILAMTGGGANTEVAGLHIFYKAFIYLQFGPATAMAWLLGLMLIGFTVYQLRILSRIEFRTTGGDGQSK